MSTAIQDTAEEISRHDWPCYCDECNALQPLPVHNFAADESRRREIWKLMMVCVGQREEADIADNGWHMLWCIDCEQCTEAFQGKLEVFAENAFDTGWTVVSLDNNTVICKECSNHEESDSDYSEQYKSTSGGIL